MCSSRRSLSMTVFCRSLGSEFSRLRQHALQGFKIDRLVLRLRFIDFLGERSRVVDGCLDLRFRPLEMPCYSRHIVPIVVDEQHDLPYCERASLQAGLPARSRISKVDEGKFGAAQAFLNQARTGVAGGPSVPVRHALETLPALRRQSHADDHRMSRSHEDSKCNYCKYCNI